MVIVAKVAAVFACVLACTQAAPVSQQEAARVRPALSLGKAVQVGTLAIVPIESSLPIARDKYLTLAEATKLGVVEIVEVPGQEQVNSLEVRNKSDLPILLFAGELLLGGKQDRIVAKDSIVPAKERRDVPVFCVEHGRWNGSPQFQGGRTMVVNSVRQTALKTGSQTEVWNNVAQVNATVGAAPSTGTIRGTLDDPKLRQKAEELFESVRSRAGSSGNTVGMICWIDGRIESADIFANARLFALSRDTLLRSYAMDAQLVQNPSQKRVDMKACRNFLDSIVAARRNAGENDAYGRTYVISDSTISGYEYGNNAFRSPGGSGGFGGGGFGHGTYQPGGKGKSGG